MITKDKLTSMQNQVFATMIVNPDISENFSNSLKKSILSVGLIAVLSTATFFSSNAHADEHNSLRAMLGISAVSGLLVNNNKLEGLPPECNINGVSGLGVGAATAGGALVGHQFGKGGGKTAWTYALGALSGTVALGSEGARMEKEKAACYKRIAERQARENSYNSQYAPMPPISSSEVLYTFNSNRSYGNKQVVTVNNSPGLVALKGFSQGNIDPNSDPQVSRALGQAVNGLQDAYVDFQKVSDKYIASVNGNSQLNKQSRYAVTQSDQRDVYNKRLKLQQVTEEWNNAFNRYARERAFTAAVFDNAAVDGYALNQYANTVTLFTPPPNATHACECVLPNRFSTVPASLTADR